MDTIIMFQMDVLARGDIMNKKEPSRNWIHSRMDGLPFYQLKLLLGLLFWSKFVRSFSLAAF